MATENNPAEAGAADAEITPAMIEAGLKAYWEWDPRVEEEEGLVIHVYEAMSKAHSRKCS